MDTEPVTQPRTIWQYLLELSAHTDMGTAERVAAAGVSERDFDTNPFLRMRYKLIDGILKGLDSEKLSAMSEPEAATKESQITIDLTLGELTYLDMSFNMTAWQGAYTTKQALWSSMRTLIERALRGKGPEL